MKAIIVGSCKVREVNSSMDLFAVADKWAFLLNWAPVLRQLRVS